MNSKTKIAGGGMWRLFISVMLTIATISMGGCMTSVLLADARGQVVPNKPKVKDIYPLSASSDGKYILVCFRVVEAGNEAIYTAEAPDPDGPIKEGIYEDSYRGPSFQVRTLEKGCHQRGLSINVHPVLTDARPARDASRGIYPVSDPSMVRDYYLFVYRDGSNKGLEIMILSSEQFWGRVNPRPLYYLAVPFALVADVVVTPLFVLWMGLCDSCK